jgi:hypothetical protein
MHRFPKYRWWKPVLALCLCVGALTFAATSRADGDGSSGDDYLRNPDPPCPIGAGDPDIPQNRAGSKPSVGSGRMGAGIYRNSAPVETVVSDSRVWMMRFHAAARLWAAYFVRR